MAVKLHRCRFEWLKSGRCWRVEKALKEMGVDYELAPGPSRPSTRDEMIEHTGQRLYPAIEFADGTWYREESRDMETTIRAGEPLERGREVCLVPEARLVRIRRVGSFSRPLP